MPRLKRYLHRGEAPLLKQVNDEQIVPSKQEKAHNDADLLAY
ncbi:hypothetical protein ACFQ5D_07185 [Paenibacillus farraposensis]|uniref:Uncharacterized protein n=1 Tax=Paenibacillus farraposensis TaxID=2807095 RepID=A0ABW4D9Q4_9BACL|nr:hypothetical protein [Paenibacillus farraposensis]